MTDDPDADDGPAVDPVEAELIAYMDGELDPAAAHAVETRLASDPALRTRADALKRSFDLLDFLPKHEPSPTFATRTIDRLPAVKSSPAAPPVPAVTRPPVPAVPASASLPVVPPVAAGRGWAWAVGLLVAATAALAGGYFATAAARPLLSPSATPKEQPPDDLPLADLRVIENLPLYAAADDFDFLTRLATPEFFGDDALHPDGPVPPHPVEPDKPSDQQREQLQKAFRELPAERQEAVRRLDRQLHEQEPARRDRLGRVLEAYAVWLHHLPDPDRKEVLAAPTAEKRLEAVREVRNAQWVAGLPAERQKLLKAPITVDERAKMLAGWKADDDRRQEIWRTARANWDTLVRGKPTWPFDDERMKKDVVAFARAAYRPDDPKRPPRLPAGGPTGGDLARLREALELGEQRGDWIALGQTVYALSHNPRYEMLPEPGFGQPVLSIDDLKEFGVRNFVKGPGRKAVVGQSGKWPDFALAVAEYARDAKPVLAPSVRLGPCRPAEFHAEVQKFLPALQHAATATEWAALKTLEGKWPEYPRELIRLARVHDLSVPGAMPPGPPSRWEQTYGPTRPRPGS